ncbi:hypothetical protein MUU72_14700 [Streptomyces sp. RS10V-4]|uniref:hypothetical protein n=1 Tax=Streptomyces rhizoryzae TaxID=2932493 RepID=UPI002004B123|nr:hypothetical protein [Streptomyces rhizoryzae]MCK7624336.1 hypothetical protein [Streptomyces rhizoryzae]
MSDDGRTVRGVRAPVRGWWQAWPRWVGPAAVVWAVGYAALGLGCALSGTPLFPGGGARVSAALDWGVAAVGALAAAVGAAVLRHGPRPWLRVLLRTVCGLTALAAFSLLMDLITLMFGQGVDSWPAAAQRALAAAGAVLLAATDRARLRTPAATRAAAPTRATARIQLAAVAGTAAFLPYCAMKLFWTLGGTFAGTDLAQILAVSRRNGASKLWLALESWGLDATVLLAALGVFLLWGLVRPWGQVFPRWTPLLRGRRVPRWLPLTPALIGAASLAPYGVLGIGYCALVSAGAVPLRAGDFPSPADALTVSWIGMTAFAGYGGALAAAARSYWLRTRPAARRTGV